MRAATAERPLLKWLAGGVPFRELGEAFLDQQARQRNVRHLLNRLNHLGYDVLLQPRAVEAAGP